MEEQWRKIYIDGKETFYSVSNLGNVRNDSTKTLMGGYVNNNGYRMVHLRHRINKMCSVHRLVMKAFCPCEDMNDLQIDHIDGNKLNNNLDNLRWCTHLENMRSFRSNSIGKCYQYDLEGNYLNTYCNFSEAAKILNLDEEKVWFCMQGVFYKTGKYQFRNYYKEKIEPWRRNTKAVKVFIYDNLDGKLITSYDSQRKAAEELGITTNTISRHIKSGKPFKNLIFSSNPL